ncbi:MAG TPA: hypothetical protein VFO52_04135 [Longimicrobiales bacterium]|nr:hypothetical protein [Longimicrobiales bacterium]
MSRTFLDENMLTWEVYPSGGSFDYATHPHIVFNCLSNRALRPRYITTIDDDADAERTISLASNEQLHELFKRSEQIS